MMPERILAEVRAQLPRDAIITTDVGWNKNGVGQQFPVYTPGSVLTPGGFATMGFGPPAAIGAKIARPDRVVLSLVGDGGFGQNPAALATAVEHGLAIIWLVMNNNAYGTIAGLQKAAYGLTHGTLFPVGEGGWDAQKPNYAEIARAYGCEGERLKSAADLAPALRRALASGKPYRARRADEEQPDADDRALEHPRHLRARQEARARGDGLAAMKRDILVSEVGPRDGLQSIKTIMPLAAKKAWITALAASGLREIEVGSFVPAHLLPQLADTAEVVAHALTIPNLTVAVLVPNLRGAEAAIEPARTSSPSRSPHPRRTA